MINGCSFTIITKIPTTAPPTMKTLRSILTFYKSFTFVSILITLASAVVIYLSGNKGVFMIQGFFWFKIFSLGAIFYINNTYKKDEYYYYKNLGISKLMLWIPPLVFDFVLFLFTIITIAIHNYEA